MMINNRVTLKYLHTFSIDAFAYCAVQVCTEDSLLAIWNDIVQAGFSVLILGQGSNILFLEDYHGVVLLNRIRGISVREDKYYWYLHVCSGELWHELVIYSLKNNMPGLENLALIPGYVGAAPIQNIGAYGVELQRFCEYVDILNLDIKEKIRLTKSECQFGYRHSIFKKQFGFNYAIVAVGLKLNKNWKPVLSYDGLDGFDVHRVVPQEIFNVVCSMRKKKLPDPVIFGNAGSFFKNPVINRKFLCYLLDDHPNIPFYDCQNNLVKLSAKWLIEHSDLQICSFGHAAIYNKQALVLINLYQKATALEIMTLAIHIHSKVMEHFDIYLEPEVRFFGSFGEIDSMRLFTTGKKYLNKIIQIIIFLCIIN